MLQINFDGNCYYFSNSARLNAKSGKLAGSFTASYFNFTANVPLSPDATWGVAKWYSILCNALHQERGAELRMVPL